MQADSFDVVYGGGEANVAISLANYGLDAHFVTKVPAMKSGVRDQQPAPVWGEYTSYMRRRGAAGIHFLGAQRPSR